MGKRRCIHGILSLTLATIAACGEQQTAHTTSQEVDPELHFVRGYRSASDPCKLTGESAFTNQYLDDAADLVTCPNGYDGAMEFVTQTGAITVIQTKSYTIYRVPRR
jgi:hypothetical protein